MTAKSWDLTVPANNRYKYQIPGDIRDVKEHTKIVGFYAEAQSTPDKTIAIYSGVVYFGITKIEYAGLAVVDLGTGGAFQTSALTANWYNKVLFTIDSAGTLAMTEGTQAATAGAVVAPAIPTSKFPICMITIQDNGNAGAGTILTIEQSEITQIQGFAQYEEITAFVRTIFNDVDAAEVRSTIGVAAAGANSDFENISFTATVAAKALTVALKGENGNDLSATNIGYVKLRSATLTDGKPVTRSVTSALSVVLSSGSTLGFAANETGRIYGWVIDNAGTLELSLSRTADIFPEGNLVSTTAEGGAGAADSATVMYSTTARANVACKCMVYIEITTGAVAGEWDNAPTKIQIMGPGVRRTGDIVQEKYSSTGAMATGSTAIPWDNTIPQITEGDQYMTLAITPTSAINKLVTEAQGVFAISAADTVVMALFNTDVHATNAMASVAENGHGNTPVPLHITNSRIAGVATATTERVRAGNISGLTITFNGSGGAALFNGTFNSYIRIIEVFA